jgi:hypothetical protein
MITQFQFPAGKSPRIACMAVSISLAATASLNAANFTLSIQQAAGAKWTDAIWNPGPAVPTAGNTYEVLVGARLRSPNGDVAAGGTGADGQTFTFPGDSLQLNGTGFNTTNGSGELRLKQNFNNVVFAFPGVGGNAGLILNGGIINNGDERTFTLSGSIRTMFSTTSSINPGGGAVTDISAARAFVFNATLVGSGGLSLDFAHDTTTGGAVVPALLINSSNSAFTGNWTVNSGWLKAAGLNALGFGNISLTSTQGASTLDLDYDLSNPTGSLTLAGGTSKLILDQNLTFGAVTINGVALSPGLHPFAELDASFDSNIVNGGNGSITVVPEPSAIGLLCAGAAVLIRRRRK